MRVFWLCFLFLPLWCFSEDKIHFALKEPCWSDGVLQTDKGGVVSCDAFRLQAESIVYSRKDPENVFIEAKGNIVLDYGDVVFLAQRMVYNLSTETGFLYQARGGLEPWYFGARIVELCSNGDTLLYDAYFTTSEIREMEWQITAKQAVLTPERQLAAKSIQFKAFAIPFLTLPHLHLNLNAWADSPLRYNFQFGGRQGTRLEVTYEVFSWYNWKNFLRLELSLKRGLGGGFETHYHSSNHNTFFHMVNYVARDISLSNPNRMTRYRFQGLLSHQAFCKKLVANLSWDKISDRDMPSDYANSGIAIKTVDPTNLIIRWQEKNWIGSINTLVRVNTFQTLKQELPTLSTSVRPFSIGNTGILFNNVAKWSFLEFKYANQQEKVSNYRSTRFEYLPQFYRPISLGPVTSTPYVHGMFIHYGDGPEDHYRWVVASTVGNEIYTSLSRCYGPYKHVIEPYADYQYITFPTTNPDEHFIFDITDGWYRLDQLRVGVRNFLLGKNLYTGIQRLWSIDLYTYGFFDTPTIQRTFPKYYADLTFHGMSHFRHQMQVVWNRTFNQMDEINFRTAWTLSDDLAFSAEYRHRGKYHWRKADQTNFILDSFRNEETLRNSSLSDRRDTLLVHLFFRFRPTWALHIKSRHGWLREDQPSYNEFEIDLLTTIRSVWHAKLSWQRREDDKGVRWSISLAVHLQRPEYERSPPKWVCYE